MVGGDNQMITPERRAAIKEVLNIKTAVDIGWSRDVIKEFLDSSAVDEKEIASLKRALKETEEAGEGIRKRNEFLLSEIKKWGANQEEIMNRYG